MQPDVYSLAKAGLSKDEISEISECESRERKIQMLRKCRCRLLEEIHGKQQSLDEIDYMIIKMKSTFIKILEVLNIMSRKILTAYFSASGTTANAAKRLAEAAGADLYEIKPEVPYTSADLNWMDKKSRSSIEMNDSAFRPAISGKVENMEQYDVIFVGFPIWLAYHNLIQCTQA